VALPIKTLPIIERWDCAGCGNCCRGTAIPLSDDDLQRIESQQWGKHPALAGVATTAKRSWIGNRRQIAQRQDGACVFLTADNRCRIHSEYGADAKPLVCRMYPLQLVPHQKHAILTLRRSCPAAAAENGSELKDHHDRAKKLARKGGLMDNAVQPPSIIPRHRCSWSETVRVASVIERLLTDQRFPLVRRLAHAARFCRLLGDAPQDLLEELIDPMSLKDLAETSQEDVAILFRGQHRPTRLTATMFRQVAAEYVRLHSTYRATNSWRDRWMLVRAAFAFVRGSGKVPPLHPLLPEVTFEELEEPLGHLGTELQQPLIGFFEANARSLQYAIASRPSWSLTESLTALALAFPVAMWLLRWCSHGRQLTKADVIEVVTVIDRGQGVQSLAGPQHRRRIALLARDAGLERLIAWHAR